MLAGGGILGDDAIPGNPGEVEATARRLGHAASEVEAIQRRIASVGLDVSWSGEAANAFRSSLHDLPGELEKLYTSFETASQALGSFGGELSELQDRATWYARQIQQSESDLEGAQRRHDSARSEFDAASRSHSNASDPVSKASAQHAMDNAGRAAANAGAEVEEINGQIDSMRADAHANFERYEAAASRCCAGLEAASQLGIRNSFGSWFDRHVVHGVPGKIAGAVGSAVAWTVKEGEDIAEDVEHWGEKTFSDLGKLGEDYLSGNLTWQDARNVLEDAKAPLIVAGIGLTVAAVVMTGGGAAPVLVAELAEGTTLLTAGDDILMGAGDSAEVLSGNTAYSKYLVDDGTSLAGDLIGVHGAPGAVADAKEDLALAGKAEQEMQKYAATGNSAFKGWATRYTHQMSTFKSRLTDAVKDQVKDQVIDRGGKKLGETYNEYLKPTADHKVGIPQPATAE